MDQLVRAAFTKILIEKILIFYSQYYTWVV